MYEQHRTTVDMTPGYGGTTPAFSFFAFGAPVQ